MARAADNTIAFVKEWIEGKLTKRQHMHYYVVKTPHAQFLMKANEKPDLVAIKDSNGHIFIPDDVLYNYYISDERATRNPCLALIGSGYKFDYSMISEASFNSNYAGKNLSKWKTLDRASVVNTESGINVNLTLVQIGENRYVTEHDYRFKEPLKLTEWANYDDIRKLNFRETSKEGKVQPYCSLREVLGKPNTVEEIRASYVTFAGDQAAKATVTSNWIMIPTKKKLLNEVVDTNIRDIFKTRPMPYHYGLTADLVNVETAWRRTEYPFDPGTLRTYRSSNDFINIENIPNGRAFIGSGNLWRDFLIGNMDAEMADNLIQYIDADDAWLSENGYVMAPFAHGRKFKDDLYSFRLNGYLIVVEEDNPSLMSRHTVYVKGSLLDTYGAVTTKIPTFAKMIPAPHTENIKALEGFINYVCG